MDDTSGKVRFPSLHSRHHCAIMSANVERKTSRSDESVSDEREREKVGRDDEYVQYEGDHAKEGHLQRGLQSRQISMIAVSFFSACPLSAVSEKLLAWRSCRNWSYHWQRSVFYSHVSHQFNII